MTLLTAHKILITTAVGFFFGFGLWELRGYFADENLWAIFRAGLYILIATGFAFYLRTLKKWIE